MASKVAIANMALVGELSQEQITSLLDNTRGAKLANLLYDSVAKEVMTEVEWSSASFRQTLAQDVTAPEFGFAFRYVLPNDPLFLGMIKINELRAGEITFAIEDGYLLTDDSTAKIKYKGFQTNTEAYDSMLERAIVLNLAHKMCYTLTGNMKLKEMLVNQYEFAKNNGASVDGLNSNDDNEIITSDLIDVRR